MGWDTGCRGNKIIGFIEHLTLEQYGPGIVYQLDQSSGSLNEFTWNCLHLTTDHEFGHKEFIVNETKLRCKN